MTAGRALIRLRRDGDQPKPDPTLRQAFLMFFGFFLFGVVIIVIAASEDGLTLAFWLVLGIFVAAYGAIGLVGVVWTYRAERRGRRPGSN